MIDLPRRHQSEQSPGRLRRRARRLLIAAVIELVARAILAPAAVRVLYPQEPSDRLAEFGGGVVETDGIERAQDGPGAVDVIHAPAAEPAPIRHLRAAQVFEGALDG